MGRPTKWDKERRFEKRCREEGMFVLSNDPPKRKAKTKDSAATGEFYLVMREQWELAGGDASQCPFGDDHVGPHLCWEDGEPVIVCSSTTRG